MSNPALIQSIRNAHQDHSADPNRHCDACTVLEVVDRQRTALLRLQEMTTKGQWDPVAAMVAIKEGLR